AARRLQLLDPAHGGVERRLLPLERDVHDDERALAQPQLRPPPMVVHRELGARAAPEPGGVVVAGGRVVVEAGGLPVRPGLARVPAEVVLAAAPWRLLDLLLAAHREQPVALLPQPVRVA